MWDEGQTKGRWMGDGALSGTLSRSKDVRVSDLFTVHRAHRLQCVQRF